MSNSSRTFGFAIVGLGMVAEFHAKALAEVRGARLVAVYSRNLAKTQEFALRHGGPLAARSLEELIACPGVDIVCIITPSGAHLEPALAAIQAGKHVVIEKPLEITTARVDRILQAADAARVKVAAIFQARFGPGAQAVKAALDEGRFGRLVLASAYVKWHRAPSYYTGWKGTLTLDGGGALINQGIHAVDLLQWFAGMPESVSCFATRRVHTQIEAEDTAVATLRFRSGALGVIEASTAAFPGWQRRLEICGEHGSAVLEDDTVARWDFREARESDDRIRAAKTDRALSSGASSPNAISHTGHRLQLQNLVDALAHGAELAIDGREARKAVALIEAAYASAERNAVVALG